MQVIHASLFLCFDILDDIIYTIELKQDEDMQPLIAIKKCLIDCQILKYPSLKPRGQALLCYVVSETDYELFPDLCIEQKLLSDAVQLVRSSNDTGQIFKVLQKIKSFAKIPSNRTILRHHKLLPILQTFLEKQSSSEVANLSAELICTLLSDPPDASTEEEDLLATCEKFLTTCFESNYPGLNIYIMWLV